MEQPTERPAAPPSDGELFVIQAIATIILIAALAVSYNHLVELFSTFGENSWSGYAIAGTVDSLIVLGVLGGRAARARGQEPGVFVRRALTAGIAATVVGNVHHGLRANLPQDVFAESLFAPQINALGVALVIVGVLVSLWAPLAAELAYRVLLWAQDQLRAAKQQTPAAERPATPATPVTGQDRPEPEPDPAPRRAEDQEDDERRPGPVPEPADGDVISLYRRRRAAGQPVSERRLVALARDELGREITRHQAKKAIAAARLAAGQHRRPEPTPAGATAQTELAVV